ncbi:MAG: ABC transporter six-transmembrane domain-containing protein [Pseudomonadota bacterium]
MTFTVLNAKRGAAPAMLTQYLSLQNLLKTYPGVIGLTWGLTLVEMAVASLTPLYIGFAIDGLLAGNIAPLKTLGMLLIGMIGVAVIRRLFDTRAYGTIRVEIGRALSARHEGRSLSKVNARLEMGRELADFFEERIPDIIGSCVQIIIALFVLWTFQPALLFAALAAATVMLIIYSLSHGRFFRLNGQLNHQMERQVDVLSKMRARPMWVHLNRLKRAEVRISDTEAAVYGLLFLVVVALLLFNLWYATQSSPVTVGQIFSIVTYTWDFAEAAIVFPVTLQHVSRLSEITRRIND